MQSGRTLNSACFESFCEVLPWMLFGGKVIFTEIANVLLSSNYAESRSLLVTV